ncbi:MAG: hypothetical protein IPN67_15055 [Bacteroidales bacterium]|nr:hypothetical protein [Bacteroidales bacterium]
MSGAYKILIYFFPDYNNTKEFRPDLILASRNYVTIAPVVSQHEIYEKDRMLMGEREAMNGIQIIYSDFRMPDNVSLDVHEGAHEIDLQSLLSFFEKYLGVKS